MGIKFWARLIGGVSVLAAVLGAYWLGTHRGAEGDLALRDGRAEWPPAAGEGVTEPALEPRPMPRQRAITTNVPPAASDAPPASPPPAAPEPELSPREQRDKIVKDLKASGPDLRGLAKPAATVVAGWSKKVADFGIDAEFGAFECYQQGCFMTLAQGSETAVAEAERIILRTGEFHGWQAGKMRSAVIPKPDGTVEVTWVLYPPEIGQDALAATLPPDSLEELQQEQLAQRR